MTTLLGRSTLALGTRASALARTQSLLVADAIRAAGDVEVTLVDISTDGDRTQTTDAPLELIGGTGVFVTALRERLLAGDIDLAVHSLKDLPTAPARGLVVAAVPERADARDVLVSRGGVPFADLPLGARVGTGSPRRAAQLLAVRPDLLIAPIRGNVDTRLRKVADGEYDAVVLAAAGLSRLGRSCEITETFAIDLVLPAPGQGALAVECRSDDPALAGLLARLDHAATRAAVIAERSLLATLEAGCTAPVGAYAVVGKEISLTGVVVAPDGTRMLRSIATGSVDAAESIGRRLAEDLLAAGAADLMRTST
ncbi:MAG: hydroxymethylbilane synthase [Frankiaceae bacterium]|nr:hydroxymethylbilane synthase [Frankiaceae bacterium]